MVVLKVSSSLALIRQQHDDAAADPEAAEGAAAAAAEDDAPLRFDPTSGECAAGASCALLAAERPAAPDCPRCPGGGYAPLAFSCVNRFCVGLLYGRAGRLDTNNGGCLAPRAAACLVHDLLTIAIGY